MSMLCVETLLHLTQGNPSGGGVAQLVEHRLEIQRPEEHETNL